MIFVNDWLQWLDALYELMLHELCHALTWSGEQEHHGPEFRRIRREMVQAHWPAISSWQQFDEPGDDAAYREDRAIVGELRKFNFGWLRPDTLEMQPFPVRDR